MGPSWFLFLYIVVAAMTQKIGMIVVTVGVIATLANAPETAGSLVTTAGLLLREAVDAVADLVNAIDR